MPGVVEYTPRTDSTEVSMQAIAGMDQMGSSYLGKRSAQLVTQIGCDSISNMPIEWHASAVHYLASEFPREVIRANRREIFKGFQLASFLVKEVHNV